MTTGERGAAVNAGLGDVGRVIDIRMGEMRDARASGRQGGGLAAAALTGSKVRKPDACGGERRGDDGKDPPRL
jgi:hypothetical protein